MKGLVWKDGEEKKEIKKSLVEARAFEILFPVYGLSRYPYGI